MPTATNVEWTFPTTACVYQSLAALGPSLLLDRHLVSSRRVYQFRHHTKAAGRELDPIQND